MSTIRLTTDATCNLESPAAGKPRRFQVNPAYAGGLVPGSTAKLDRDYVIDLATLTPRNDRLIANLDHVSTKRVGHVDGVENDGKSLKLSGSVSAANAAASEFLQSADGGFPWSASIEAVFDRPEFISSGVQATVNHRKFTGPIYVVRNAKLCGVALCSHGADSDARAIAAQFQLKGKAMSDSLTVTASEQTIILARCEGVELKCKSAFQARLEGVKSAALSGEIDALAFEREVADIEANDRELHEIRAGRPKAGTFSNAIGQDGITGTGSAITAALCLQGGLTNPEKHFDERLLDAADKIGRHVGLQSLLMQAACGNGYRANHAETITQGNLRPVLEAAFSPTAKLSGWSTVAIPGILSNVANKFLIDGWQETSGDEWRKISEVKPVKNFKDNTFYRMLENAEYEKVGTGGELHHGSFGEQTMTVKADTYGKMYAITRTDIINDDLGALTDVPRRLGRAAGIKFRRVYWAAFLAGDSFFHSSNGNVLTGSGTALIADGVALQNALTAFRQMRTSTADGRKLIGGKPAALLVPPELEIVARRLLTSTGIVAGGGSSVDSMPSGNPFQGLAELVVVDWLSDSDFTGYSAAKWYLLRSPSIAPAMLVAFLDGQQAPTVQTADADFNVLGIQMRGYHDFGVGRGEPLCGLQVAGTA